MARYAATTQVRGSSGQRRYSATTKVRGFSSQAAYAATTRVRGFVVGALIVAAGASETVEGGLVRQLDPEMLFGGSPDTWLWRLKSSSDPTVTHASLKFTQLDVNGLWQYTTPGVESNATLVIEVVAQKAGVPDATSTLTDTILAWPGPWCWRTIGGVPKFVASFQG